MQKVTGAMLHPISRPLDAVLTSDEHGSLCSTITCIRLSNMTGTVVDNAHHCTVILLGQLSACANTSHRRAYGISIGSLRDAHCFYRRTDHAGF